MAGPQDIQAQAGGLLNLLGMQSGGQLPRELDGKVFGVLELRDHYALNRIRTGQVTGAAGAFTRTTTQVMSPGPSRLLSIGAEVTFGAAGGTFLHIAVGLRIPTDANAIAWIHAETYGAVAAGGFRAMGLPCDILMPTGTVILTQAFSDAGGADHVLRQVNVIEVLV